MTPDEIIQHYLDRIRNDDLLTAGYFDDDEPDGPDNNLEFPPTTKYLMASDLVKAVRDLHYNSQVRVFKAFHKFIIKGIYGGNMFLKRLEESYGYHLFRW